MQKCRICWNGDLKYSSQMVWTHHKDYSQLQTSTCYVCMRGNNCLYQQGAIVWKPVYTTELKIDKVIVTFHLMFFLSLSPAILTFFSHISDFLKLEIARKSQNCMFIPQNSDFISCNFGGNKVRNASKKSLNWEISHNYIIFPHISDFVSKFWDINKT